MCFHVFPSLTRLGTDPLLQCNLLRPRPQRRPQRVGTGLDQLEGCCALLRLVAWLSGNLVMVKVVRWLTWRLWTCLVLTFHPDRQNKYVSRRPGTKSTLALVILVVVPSLDKGGMLGQKGYWEQNLCQIKIGDHQESNWSRTMDAELLLAEDKGRGEGEGILGGSKRERKVGVLKSEQGLCGVYY